MLDAHGEELRESLGSIVPIQPTGGNELAEGVAQLGNDHFRSHEGDLPGLVAGENGFGGF